LKRGKLLLEGGFLPGNSSLLKKNRTLAWRGGRDLRQGMVDNDSEGFFFFQAFLLSTEERAEDVYPIKEAPHN